MHLIFGKKGTGKTHEAKRLIAGKKDLIIFDRQNEYTGKLVTSPAELIDAIQRNDFPIRILALEDNQEDFFRVLIAAKNYTLVIDEFHFYSNAWTKKSVLNNLVRVQRHQQIEIIGISQRPGDINVNIFSQADRITTFKQIIPDDIKRLSRFGFDPVAIAELSEERHEKITIDI